MRVPFLVQAPGRESVHRETTAQSNCWWLLIPLGVKLQRTRPYFEIMVSFKGPFSKIKKRISRHIYMGILPPPPPPRGTSWFDSSRRRVVLKVLIKCLVLNYSVHVLREKDMRKSREISLLLNKISQMKS